MIHIGSTLQQTGDRTIAGEFVSIDGEQFYRIANCDAMPPFFMTVTSSANHWLFISSNGALTAGRTNCDSALFPYYTDDKIHDSAGITGSTSILLVTRGEKTFLWEPFSARYEGLYRVQRNIYKNLNGNVLMFEEVNRDLQLTFSYSWRTSDHFGFVKTSCITNNASVPASVRFLDGLNNLLPYGLTKTIQTQLSTLADGYKKNELIQKTGLGIFTLNAMMVDRPEPSEALKASVAWSLGLEKPIVLLSSRQLDIFRRGEPVKTETEVRGTRGAYILCSDCSLDSGGKAEWRIIADVNQSHADIAALNHLRSNSDAIDRIERDIAEGARRLAACIANADGIELTADRLSTSRHASNVLLNVMRGGIFADGYVISPRQFSAHIRASNSPAALRHARFLDDLPASLPRRDFLERVKALGDPNLTRLASEYLPITFSRRHGDPSRPWNAFSINIKNPDGTRKISYQGNWRDIFQNWEALSHSFPSFIEAMIAKFLNASTADGYNPYRITDQGFDWETPEPNNPWSHIGYWGDHQIVYLLRLLEISHAYHPGELAGLLTEDIFAYANIPYRIKPYRDMLADPHRTIDFDSAADTSAEQLVQKVGSDGKLLRNSAGDVCHVNLTEKLLIPVLAKLTNFIPDSGIWLNTQRPEWNDANNALVGNGVSMVTVYYLRRYLRFCRDLFAAGNGEVTLSPEVLDTMRSIAAVFEKNVGLLAGTISDADRRRILDELGSSGTVYRTSLYARGLSSDRQYVPLPELVGFADTTLAWLDHAIAANKRDDGLYHSYNLMTVAPDSSIPLGRLYEMLEGQVAVLSSGVLTPSECVELLDCLRASAMYREDLGTYLLYPDRKIPRFVEKNVIPASSVAESSLLRTLITAGDTRLVEKGVDGVVHFNGNFHNATDARSVLTELSRDARYSALIAKDTPVVEAVFESVFNHKAFTGRSGTFFKYEGLGSIYWHMVSKLLLAVQEVFRSACASGADASVIKRLAEHYYAVRAGLGTHKSPKEYGAFPMDAYSHTPAHLGAQQPGMTGQVKEDVLARLGEMGIIIDNGEVVFDPTLLRSEEFLREPASFVFHAADGSAASIPMNAQQLAFTYCQVPIVYSASTRKMIRVMRNDGTTRTISGNRLGTAISREVFERTGAVVRIEVEVTKT